MNRSLIPDKKQLGDSIFEFDRKSEVTQAATLDNSGCIDCNERINSGLGCLYENLSYSFPNR